MLSQKTLQFLYDLKQNNNREWFKQNIDRYESAKTDYLEFAQELLVRMKAIDVSLVNLNPKDCIFRIYRDMRFSQDKTPYKTHLGIVFSKDRKKSQTAAYYIHIEESGSFIAGGVHNPPPETLKKIRLEISNFYDDFTHIIKNNEFKTRFTDLYRDKNILLKRPPQGFYEDNKAIEYIKLKSFEVVKEFDTSYTTTKKGVDFIVENLTYIKPLNDFLNRAFD